MKKGELRRILRSPFLYALLPSVLFYTVILSRNWIPIHDAFQTTNVAYFLINEAVTHHALPLWYPYINNGLDANWYLAFTLGPSLATMLQVARFLGRGDLLQYYYVSMFLDELILLIGTYLLARTLFRRRLTVLFVCIAMTGSTLWFAQPWWNFHLYYFVPLSAYFIITGIARTELWRVLAGGLVLLISEFGNLPYFVVSHALTYASLVAGAWWAYRFDIRKALRRAGIRELIILAASALTAATYLVLLAHGAQHINYDFGRTRDAVSAENFLTYGSGIGLSKFAELVTGVSWNIDANAYAGVLVLGSAVFGLVWAAERRMVPFLGTAVLFALLSVGKESFVAPLLYQLPGIAYFRHIGLLLPLIKVMLIVLSGFGVEALLNAGDQMDQVDRGSARQAYRTMAIILGLMLLVALPVVGLAAAGLISGNEHLLFAVQSEATTGFTQMQELVSRTAFVGIVYVTALSVLAAASIRARTSVPVLGVLLLVVQTVDAYSYRMSQFQTHMVPIDANYRKLLTFVEKPFAMRRTRDPMENAAFRLVESRLGTPIGRDWYDRCVRLELRHCYYDFEGTKAGVYYDTVEPFIGLDPCRSIFRVDYWLPGIDTFYRAIAGLPLHDLSKLPEGYGHRRIYFPVGIEAVDKATGCEFPKLQLFSSLTVVRDESQMAGLMRNPQYTGDLLLSSGSDYAAYLEKRGSAGTSDIADARVDIQPGTNTRVQGEVRVLSATANTLIVQAVTPQGAGRDWLYYADAWHPFWHAQVNGVEVPILRADFGFQAVTVPRGVAIVKFAYRSGMLSAALAVAQVLLIATTLTIMAVGVRELFHS